MRAALDDPPVIHHQDQIGIADRAQAVGDDESRPPLQQTQQRLLNMDLRARVDAASRLIED